MDSRAVPLGSRSEAEQDKAWPTLNGCLRTGDEAEGQVRARVFFCQKEHSPHADLSLHMWGGESCMVVRRGWGGDEPDRAKSGVCGSALLGIGLVRGLFLVRAVMTTVPDHSHNYGIFDIGLLSQLQYILESTVPSLTFGIVFS